MNNVITVVPKNMNIVISLVFNCCVILVFCEYIFFRLTLGFKTPIDMDD